MELFDLYTKDRIKTGKTMVRGTKLEEGYYRMVVYVCIFNSKGEMLIQLRQHTKSDYPDMWDLSVAGSAVSGDTSSMAAKRELEEELGITLDLDNAHALTFNDNRVFCDYYIVNKDLDINKLVLQEEEVKDVKWASIEDILSMIKEGNFIPYKEVVIELLFNMKDGFGARK